MKPEIAIEVDKFQSVMKRWLLTTSRELSVAVNARMAFLLMRVFALMKPQRVQEKRNEVRAYMQQPIGERRIDKKSGKPVGVKVGRVFRRVHLIAQARHKLQQAKDQGDIAFRGLYGERMKEASASLQRRAIGSVGYLKSALIGPIRELNGKYGFTQLGRGSRGKKAGVSGNAAFMRLLSEYGINSGTGNVARMRGAKHSIYLARHGLNPLATVRLSVGIADGQTGRVEAEYSEPFQRALQDERLEMERHLASKLEETAQAAINGQSR